MQKRKESRLQAAQPLREYAMRASTGSRWGFDNKAAGVLDSEFFIVMQQLHPYWRMDYIEAPRAPASSRPFTELPALGDDRSALIVHRSAFCYLMLNRFPYNPGHLLAIPFREVTDLPELSGEEAGDLFEMQIFAERLLRHVMRPDAFNIGFNLGSSAGGSIAHLHAHIVPRWNGDNNFMPVIGQTRILPQALEQTWERLVGGIPTLPARV